MKPWNWKSHVAVAAACAVVAVAFLLFTEGCAQKVTLTCPSGVSFEVNERGEEGWHPSPEDVREYCGGESGTVE